MKKNCWTKNQEKVFWIIFFIFLVILTKGQILIIALYLLGAVTITYILIIIGLYVFITILGAPEYFCKLFFEPDD